MVDSRDAWSLGARVELFADLLKRCQFIGPAGLHLAEQEAMETCTRILRAAREHGNSVYVVGNGGSAGVASHAVTDFLNVAKLRAQTIHDSSMLTCMANDYGYENAFARMLSVLARSADVLIAISSSGKSSNIHNAARCMISKGGSVITLSGFESGNPLRQLGDLNIWVDSGDYGFVEIAHQFILHNLADRFGRELADAARSVPDVGLQAVPE